MDACQLYTRDDRKLVPSDPEKRCREPMLPAATTMKATRSRYKEPGRISAPYNDFRDHQDPVHLSLISTFGKDDPKFVAIINLARLG